jgi:hypothetical protein
MAERTYLYGYGSGPWGSSGTRRTKTYIMSQVRWNGVHPELMRRLFALADYVIDSGSDYGFGDGRRSTQDQYLLFKSRYRRVSSPPWDVYWNGQPFWPTEAGNYFHYTGATAAPPGRSYHEPTTAKGTGYALAADMLGNHLLGNAAAGLYGLRHFAEVNGEPWHYQGLEYPNARLNYTNQFENPAPWPFPGDPVPPPDMSDFHITDPVRILDTRYGTQHNGRNSVVAAGEVITVRPHGFTPTDAKGLILNVTAPGVSPGFFTFWSGANGVAPVASQLNVNPGIVTNAMVWVPLGGFGTVSVLSSQVNHLIIDEAGWFWQD